MIVNVKKMEIQLVNKGMNFKDLMEKTKLSSGSISKVKNGKNVSLKTLSKIVQVLEIKVQDII